MSTTTTETPLTLSLQQTLGEYEVHVSGQSSDNHEEVLSPNTSNNQPDIENPPSWPENHFRIPPYRPINRNLNLAERPNGSILPERIFLTLMFLGVALNAGTAQVWGATGGKYFTKVFKYAIGGEW